MKKAEPVMAQHLEKLSHQEQQIICFHVRKFCDEARYIHLGPHLLPFVPVRVVRHCLLNGRAVRAVAAIISKLGIQLSNAAKQDSKAPRLSLVDKKVARLFGNHPEKGRAITWLPGKPVVALKCAHTGTGWGMWEISVAKQHQTAVVCWLNDVCG